MSLAERCVLLSSIRKESLAVAALLIVALVELLRTAWLSDDALITLRTVLNVTHGYGARFNIDERVQGFTHPFWFLLIAGGTLIVRNIYVVTFALSIALSLAALWLLLSRVATNFGAGVLAACILMLSRAWVDYSTSGLENPLSHVLILLAILAAAQAIEQRTLRAVSCFFSHARCSISAAPTLCFWRSRSRFSSCTRAAISRVCALPRSLLALCRRRPGRCSRSTIMDSRFPTRPTPSSAAAFRVMS